jgi:hypothetical protein
VREKRSVIATDAKLYHVKGGHRGRHERMQAAGGVRKVILDNARQHRVVDSVGASLPVGIEYLRQAQL